MFDRITSDPAILGGRPVIEETRISVELILEWMASGASRDEIVARHPHLKDSLAKKCEHILVFRPPPRPPPRHEDEDEDDRAPSGWRFTSLRAADVQQARAYAASSFKIDVLLTAEVKV